MAAATGKATEIVMKEDVLEKSISYALDSLNKTSIKLSSFQKCALSGILSGRDTFVSLPMGHGKSVLFESFPHCWKYLQKSKGEEKEVSVIVISPLIELMNSQVRDLRRRCQRAVRLSSDISKEEESLLRKGLITYVFSSPELLLEGHWRILLRSEDFTRSV